MRTYICRFIKKKVLNGSEVRSFMKRMHVISEKEDKDARLWATDCLKYGEDLGHALFSPQASDTSPC